MAKRNDPGIAPEGVARPEASEEAAPKTPAHDPQTVIVPAGETPTEGGSYLVQPEGHAVRVEHTVHPATMSQQEG